jgi:DNA-binding MarR family transcriptional regulator
MTSWTNDTHRAEILRETIVSLVRTDERDLTARQLAVFLTAYVAEGPHTVRGLAAELNVGKPAITRALDRLCELDLVSRQVDPMDRRSVLVKRTLSGIVMLRQIARLVQEAEALVNKRAADRAASATR